MSGSVVINGVAAIRVSTTKQGTDGDSPEAQKEQIEGFAESRGITIKKIFVFLESASKEQQPMQEAIDYCKKPKIISRCSLLNRLTALPVADQTSIVRLKSNLNNVASA